ncbi:hypothetical protein LINPERHAP1_LOCUS24825 [Linum perenne]
MAKGTKEKEGEMVTKSSMAILFLQAPLPKVVGFNPSSLLQFAPCSRIDEGLVDEEEVLEKLGEKGF